MPNVPQGDLKSCVLSCNGNTHLFTEDDYYISIKTEIEMVSIEGSLTCILLGATGPCKAIGTAEVIDYIVSLRSLTVMSTGDSSQSASFNVLGGKGSSSSTFSDRAEKRQLTKRIFFDLSEEYACLKKEDGHLQAAEQQLMTSVKSILPPVRVNFFQPRTKMGMFINTLIAFVEFEPQWKNNWAGLQQIDWGSIRFVNLPNPYDVRRNCRLPCKAYLPQEVTQHLSITRCCLRKVEECIKDPEGRCPVLGRYKEREKVAKESTAGKRRQQDDTTQAEYREAVRKAKAARPTCPDFELGLCQKIGVAGFEKCANIAHHRGRRYINSVKIYCCSSPEFNSTGNQSRCNLGEHCPYMGHREYGNNEASQADEEMAGGAPSAEAAPAEEGAAEAAAVAPMD